MLRNPELYKPEVDRSLKVDGYVYIEDLALSGVILALKRGSTIFSPMQSMGLGGLLRGQDTTAVDELHDGIAEGIKGIDKWWIKKGRRVELPDYPGIAILKGYNGQFGVETKTLDFCDVNATFVTGEDFDIGNLTGFLGFHPGSYDHSHESGGLAQTIVSAHREDPTLFTSQFMDQYQAK